MFASHPVYPYASEPVACAWQFDDVCKHRGCENWMEGTAVHMGGPTLAVCELVRAGLLSTVETSYGGVRQWVLMRANGGPTNTSTAAGARGGEASEGLHLPCAGEVPHRPRCTLRWSRRAPQRVWDGDEAPYGPKARRAQQRMTHGPGCSSGHGDLETVRETLIKRSVVLSNDL